MRVGGEGTLLTECGTRLYYAPELLFGLPYNERVDIWASGLCLCWMITAKIPFDVASRKVRKKLKASTLPSIDFDRIPNLMKNLMEQCLAVEMINRPPAMELLVHPIFAKMPAPPELSKNELVINPGTDCSELKDPPWERGSSTASTEGEKHHELSSRALHKAQRKRKARKRDGPTEDKFLTEDCSELKEIPSAPSTEWKESRDVSSRLESLAQRKCSRALGTDQNGGYNQEIRPDKFLTTSGATHKGVEIL
jgi:serine/threonine protein kinase